MATAHEIGEVEKKVETACALILKTDAEFWEIRNKSILGLTSLIGSYDRHPAVAELFGMNVFRLLKEPVKSMIADLRSQQVRDTCAFLTKMSQVLGDHFRHFLRDSFGTILDGVKVPNKVMSGYVDECIMSMIKQTTFKGCVPIIIAEIRDSKAKVVRERCLEYINEILAHWEILEKDAEMLMDPIRLGLEDASVRGREIARLAYLNLFQLFPKKADRIKAGLSSTSLKSRLTKQEEEHVQAVKKVATASPSLALAAAAAAAASDAVKASGSGKVVSTITAATQDALVAAAATVAAASSTSTTSFAIDTTDPSSSSSTATAAAAAMTPGKLLTLRARRQSCQEDAVTSIQAIVRGALTRRQSLAATSKEDGSALSPFASRARAMTPVPSSSSSSSSSGGKGSSGNKSSSKKKRRKSGSGSGEKKEATSSSISNSTSKENRGPSSLPRPVFSPARTTILAPSSSTSANTNTEISSSSSSKPAAAAAAAQLMQDAQKRKKLAGLLKLKISRMMELLTQELELVGSLEEASSNKGVDGLNDEAIVEEIMSLGAQEEKLAVNFRERVMSLLA